LNLSGPSCDANDFDGDGVVNAEDNCPNHPNPDQADCDNDGVGDVCTIATGQSADCDGNGVPDECLSPADDCNGNGVPDVCDIADGVSIDCDGNGVPDECEIDPICNNDFCENATILCPGAVSGSTTGATNDGSVSCGAAGNSPDVWYAYTAASSGTATFSTCGSWYDTFLSVHTGCPGTAANEIACNDDACGNFDSSVTVSVIAGETYLVRVSGYNGDTGDFILEAVAPDCSATAPRPGDITGDGIVDAQDWLELIAAWGSCPGCAADTNGDGVVDALDVLVVIANWG
jgi:hypothetical protein